MVALLVSLCFFQAEDGIRDLVRSRGLGDVYKRQALRAERLARMKAMGLVGADVSLAPRMPNVPAWDLSLIHI